MGHFVFDYRSHNLQCQRVFQVNAPVNCVCLHPNQVNKQLDFKTARHYLVQCSVVFLFVIWTLMLSFLPKPFAFQRVYIHLSTEPVNMNFVC